MSEAPLVEVRFRRRARMAFALDERDADGWQTFLVESHAEARRAVALLSHVTRELYELEGPVE